MKNGSAEKLMELVGKKGLVEVVLEYWLGREVGEGELQMMEELMVLSMDHRAEAPSAAATIEAGKAGKDLVRSVEAGIGKIDGSHGAAVEGMGKILVEDQRGVSEIVADWLGRGERMPGMGHRIYKEGDPRTKYLLQRAKSLGFSGRYIKKVKEIERELEKQKGKFLPVNIDGAIAAVLAEIGVEPELMNGFFLWPRVAGLIYRWRMANSE